jgi:hypothetical protein
MRRVDRLSVFSPRLILRPLTHPIPLTALLPSSAPSTAPSSLDLPLHFLSPSKKEKNLPIPPHNKPAEKVVDKKSRRLSSIGASSPSPGPSASPFASTSDAIRDSSSPEVNKKGEKRIADVNALTPAPSTSSTNAAATATDTDGTDEDLEYERALIQIAEDELGLRKRKLELERKMRKRGKVEG